MDADRGHALGSAGGVHFACSVFPPILAELMGRFLLFVRSLVFYIGYVGSTILWGLFASITGWFVPRKLRFEYVIVTWVSFVLWWLRLICGISVKVEGQENLTGSAGVLFVKHQSTWDALFSQLLVRPQTTVIKKHLLMIPFFGWALAVTNPIRIDRNQKLSSLRNVLEQGKSKLAQNVWVTLFPEGTRVKAGEIGKFHPGGAMLAAATGASVHVVAHNGGRHWPLHDFIKYPGQVRVCVSDAISSVGRSATDINQEAEAWMRRTMGQLDVQQ